MQPQVIDIGITCIEQSTVLFGDNEPASHIIWKKHMYSGRTKHIDIKVKFCGEVLSRKDKIILKYKPSKFSFADIFTNPLNTVRFRDVGTVLVQNLEKIINDFQYLQHTFTVLKIFLNSFLYLLLHSG